MKVKILLCLLLILGYKNMQAQQPINVTSSFAEGVGLSAAIDWIMDIAYPDQKNTPEYKAKRGTLEVIMKAITDRVFRDQLVGQLFATNDPRRYLLTALFQSGKFAHKGLQFIQQFVSKLPDWYASKHTEKEYMTAFPSEDFSQWFRSDIDQCPVQQTLSEKILDKLVTVQEAAFSCVTSYLISLVASRVITQAMGQPQTGKSSLIDFGRLILPSLAGAFGTPYIVDWAKGILNDISLVEGSPAFKGIPLTAYCHNCLQLD